MFALTVAKCLLPGSFVALKTSSQKGKQYSFTVVVVIAANSIKMEWYFKEAR